MNKIKVSWRSDKNSDIQSKLYDSEEIAIKARNWLIQNGAYDIDVAVVLDDSTSKSLT